MQLAERVVTLDDRLYQVWRSGQEGSWQSIAPLADNIASRSAKPCPATIVVGTFGSIPYVHLQLEAWHRLYPSFPLLVHDDASGKEQALRQLCAAYGAAFETNGLTPESRLSKGSGDLSVFVGGLQFAAEHGAYLLIKLSRRCVPVRDFRPSLARAASKTQAPLIGAPYANLSAAQTQCIALRTSNWLGTGVRDRLRGLLGRARAEGKAGLFVEALLARIAAEEAGAADPSMWLVPWAFAVYPGKARQGYFWHRSHTIGDYAALAGKWGLDYSTTDFVPEA